MEPFLFNVHVTLPCLSNLALIAFGLQPDSLLAMYKNSFCGNL